MATKDKDKKGPSTQRTGTQGVNAIGVNHGMTRQEAVKPTPEQAMAQMSQTVVPQQPQQVNYAPGFTDVAGSPSYQQYGTQQVQQAPVAVQAGQQQVQPQTNTNVQQNPVNQTAQASSVAASVQPVQQQFAMPQRIALPNGQTILVHQSQPESIPVNTGVGTVNIPVVGDAAPQKTTQPTQSQPAAKSTAQQNEEYERQRQYNQSVDEYLKAGGSYNAVRPHGDITRQNEPESVQKWREGAQAKAKDKAQQPTNTDEDEYIKTLKEYFDSKYESPEDREAREKREARQRKWAAISEGIANVFNVGGAIAGARPAQWKSGVGELYANQEAETDKRRLEYRQALKDMIDYRTAIRNGDIARARAIEERRKNDIYEYRIMQDLENKAAEQKLKEETQAKEQARKDQEAKNRQRQYDDKHEEHVDKKARGYTTARSSSSGGGRKKSSGGSRATGAAAAKSAKAAAKRRAKAATQGTKFGKK